MPVWPQKETPMSKVGNIVLDVDFRLARPVPAGTLEAAMRGFRRAVLDALALLFLSSSSSSSSYGSS